MTPHASPAEGEEEEFETLGLRTGEYVNARKLHVTEGVDRESENGFVI